MRCPCRKKSEATTYAECCEPFHTGSRVPPTAERLMRSRYSAFALAKVDYLRATWHASTRPEHLTPDPGRQWIQLRVLEAKEAADTATVAFVARSRWSTGGRTDELRETSRFVREGGRWFYVDGAIEP